MDKKLQKIIKDPKRQDKSNKSNETYMKSLKEDTLKDYHFSTFRLTDNSTPSTGSSFSSTSLSANRITIRSSDTKIYGVGIDAVLTMFCI